MTPTAAAPTLASRIAALRVRCVDVPIPKPHPTAGGILTSAPLALIDIETDDGLTGRSYVFTYTKIALASVARLIADLEPVLVGEPLAPLALAQTLQTRFRLLGAQGVAQMAAGGIDMAAWDALALGAGVPLVRLLGGVPKAMPCYQSLGMAPSVEAGVDDALEAVSLGFRAVKFKVGGPNVRADVAFLRAVRAAIGPEIDVMVDYNQSLSAAEAVRRGRALEEFDLTWFEEPCRMDDDAGHATVAAALDVPVLFGENWWSASDALRAIAARALDEVMLDVMKIGGVTGWLQAAAVASSAQMRLSSHLFTEFSAHLIAASPVGRYVEWLDLVSPILEDPLLPRAGTVTIGERPGVGLAWNEEAVRAYSV